MTNPQSNNVLTARPKSQDALHTSSHGKSTSMITKKVVVKNELCVKGKVMKQEEGKKKSKSKTLLDKERFKIEGKKCTQKPHDNKKK